jgi:hypothetical protein
MPRHPRRWSKVPWWLLDSDLCPAHEGEPDLTLIRDLRTPEGQPQRHLALQVMRQYKPGELLGLVAIRCERRGERLTPISMAIPDGPIEVPEVDGLQSNPRRFEHDDSESEETT